MEKRRWPRLEYTVYGQSNLGREQRWRPEGVNEYCSPENFLLLKLLQGCCATPTCTVAGKADVCWEETTTCTNAGAGIGVLASTNRFAEITTGKSYGQLGG